MGQGGFGNRGGFGGGMPPAPVEENKKSSQKKSFKGKKPVYNRKDREDIETVDKLLNQKKKQTIHTNPVPKEIEIMDSISVSELAKKMNLKASEIIAKLMGMGMMVSIFIFRYIQEEDNGIQQGSFWRITYNFQNNKVSSFNPELD